MKHRTWIRVFCCPLVLAVVAINALGWGTLASAGNFSVSGRAEMMDTMVRVRAIQFLQRATFGPTDTDVDALVVQMKQLGIQQAASDWIDDQFAMPATSHVQTATEMVAEDGWDLNNTGAWIWYYRYHAFWHNTVTAPDQLKQRLAWALSQIVVVNNKTTGVNSRFLDKNDVPDWLALPGYYDMLLENCDDNYLELLEDVTFSPVMGRFLSHYNNRKADPSAGTFPDENYAREIMQLFTIGLHELKQDGRLKLDNGELIPTYDNDTIKTFARLFTGFRYTTTDSAGNVDYSRDMHNPMFLANSRHDFDSKELFPGETLDGFTDGNAEVKAGLNILFNHANTAPFVSRLLIQRLVRSNPSRNYIRRVAAVFKDNGQGQRGDMKAVVKAILLDRECWNSIRVSRKRGSGGSLQVRVRGTGTERNRMAEPLVMYAGFLRRFGVATNQAQSKNKFKLFDIDDDWPQEIYRSPSVFNFYLPDHQPAGPIGAYSASRRIPNGAIYAPEFQIFNSVAANTMANRYRSDIYNGTRVEKLGTQREVRVDFDISAVANLANDPEAMVEYLDMNLCAGTMKQSFRNQLVNAINDETSSLNDGDYRRDQRAQGALLSVMMSPAQMIVE